MNRYNFKTVESYLKSENFKGDFTYNPWFNISNMLVTLWLARDRIKDGFVLLYGDIVFDGGILDNLLDTKADITLAVDKKTEFDEEDEKVAVKNGLVVSANKSLDNSEAYGEFIGMAKFSKRGADLLFREIDKIVKEGNLMAFLCHALERLAKNKVKLNILHTDSRPWSDNDCLPDLRKTRNDIYPAICERLKRT